MEAKCECGGHHHGKERQFHICVYCHESAVIGAITGSFEEHYSVTVSMLKKLMKEAAGKIEALRGTIGHVKSFVRSLEDSCMLSITDDEVSVAENKEKRTEFDCAVIVFGITEKQLYEVLTDVFNGI